MRGSERSDAGGAPPSTIGSFFGRPDWRTIEARVFGFTSSPYEWQAIVT
jgi:hypothetical protein